MTIPEYRNTEKCQTYSSSNAQHNTRSLVDSQNLPLPSYHKIEGLVNLIQRQSVCHKFIQEKLSTHIIQYQLGHCLSTLPTCQPDRKNRKVTLNYRRFPLIYSEIREDFKIILHITSTWCRNIQAPVDHHKIYFNLSGMLYRQNRSLLEFFLIEYPQKPE